MANSLQLKPQGVINYTTSINEIKIKINKWSCAAIIIILQFFETHLKLDLMTCATKNE